MKSIKRILGIATATILSICNISINPVIASTFSYEDNQQYGDYLYYVTIDEDQDGTYDYIKISGCDESATEIEIPSEIDGLPVKIIGNWAFVGCTSLEKISIPNSITDIDYAAFYKCHSLKNIDIPDSVINIGDFAFFRCINLKNVTIPESVSTIGEWAFYYCESLESITIENPDCEIYDSKNTICNYEDDSKEYYFNGTIYGYDNSTAQSYAEKYGYDFKTLNETPIISVITGDANEDGELNVRDASTIARFLAEGRKDELPKQADYNGDGEINVRDASLIARFLANKKS